MIYQITNFPVWKLPFHSGAFKRVQKVGHEVFHLLLWDSAIGTRGKTSKDIVRGQHVPAHHQLHPHCELNSQHERRDLYDHAMVTGIFTLITNNIFIKAPKIMRKTASAMIYMCWSSRTNCLFISYMKWGQSSKCPFKVYLPLKKTPSSPIDCIKKICTDQIPNKDTPEDSLAHS